VPSLLAKLLRPRIGRLRHHKPCPLYTPPHYRRQPPHRSWPRISIVTPSFNAARYLERTVSSVLDQQYPNLDYILQDGGSADGTDAILERYRPRLSHCSSEPDRGQSDALNRGFRHATGEILAYLNADDLLLPGSLHYVGAFFADHPIVDVVYGHRVLVDEEDREIGRWVLPPHDNDVLSWADYVPQETLFWRRRVWDAIGGRIDETLQFAMDWDLLVRLRDAGARFARLPRFLGAFRVHADQKTSARLDTVGALEMTRIRTRIHGHPVSIETISHAIRGYLARHVVFDRLYRAGILRY
jgi:glycosyltransferase involved in cell wall biosynthesis